MAEQQKSRSVLPVILLVAVALAVGAGFSYLFFSSGDEEAASAGSSSQGRDDAEALREVDGVEVIYEASGDVSGAQMDETLEVIRERLDRLDICGAEITRQGENQISVALAGITGMDQAAELIGKTAQLEFKKVDQVLTAEVIAGTRAFDTLPPGKQLLLQQQRDESGNLVTGDQGKPMMIPYVVDAQPLLTGEALAGASAGRDQFGKPKVDMEFTDDGAEQFSRVTEELALAGSPGSPSRMAIVLDDEVVSAPSVQQQIRGKNAEITGNMTSQEVDDIVLVLQSGALPVELETISKNEARVAIGKECID